MNRQPNDALSPNSLNSMRDLLAFADELAGSPGSIAVDLSSTKRVDPFIAAVVANLILTAPADRFSSFRLPENAGTTLSSNSHLVRSGLLFALTRRRESVLDKADSLQWTHPWTLRGGAISNEIPFDLEPSLVVENLPGRAVFSFVDPHRSATADPVGASRLISLEASGWLIGRLQASNSELRELNVTLLRDVSRSCLELAENIFDHARLDSKSSSLVQVDLATESQVIISVSDNGVGLVRSVAAILDPTILPEAAVSRALEGLDYGRQRGSGLPRLLRAARENGGSFKLATSAGNALDGSVFYSSIGDSLVLQPSIPVTGTVAQIMFPLRTSPVTPRPQSRAVKQPELNYSH